MPLQKAFASYNGSKSNSGAYQHIINHIPPHLVFYSLYLGNCAVTRHISPASLMVLNDVDPDVIKAWGDLVLPSNYLLSNQDALMMLKLLQMDSVTPVDQFIFLGPPYRMASRSYKGRVYNFDVDDQHHVDLASQITAMSDRKIMLCHYPDPFYDDALSGWHTFDYRSMTRRGLVTERLYYNYDLSDGLLHDYSYIGQNFRQREAWERQRIRIVNKLNELPLVLKNAIISDITSQK